MINFLVRLHLHKMLRVDAKLSKVNVPLRVEVLVSRDAPIQILLGDISNYVIGAFYK